jgi:hypothetical protein
MLFFFNHFNVMTRIPNFSNAKPFLRDYLITALDIAFVEQNQQQLPFYSAVCTLIYLVFNTQANKHLAIKSMPNPVLRLAFLISIPHLADSLAIYTAVPTIPSNCIQIAHLILLMPHVFFINFGTINLTKRGAC